MAPTSLNNDSILHSQRTRMFMFMCIVALTIFVLPGLAFAQSDASETISTTCGFANSINSVLNALSVVVVTIAVIFSGYQIAFAHKRISDVAPVLIGAILIGAAGQIAKMFLASSSGNGCGATSVSSLLSHALMHYA